MIERKKYDRRNCLRLVRRNRKQHESFHAKCMSVNVLNVPSGSLPLKGAISQLLLDDRGADDGFSGVLQFGVDMGRDAGCELLHGLYRIDRSVSQKHKRNILHCANSITHQSDCTITSNKKFLEMTIDAL